MSFQFGTVQTTQAHLPRIPPMEAFSFGSSTGAPFVFDCQCIDIQLGGATTTDPQKPASGGGGGFSFGSSGGGPPAAATPALDPSVFHPVPAAVHQSTLLLRLLQALVPLVVLELLRNATTSCTREWWNTWWFLVWIHQRQCCSH